MQCDVSLGACILHVFFTLIITVTNHVYSQQYNTTLSIGNCHIYSFTCTFICFEMHSWMDVFGVCFLDKSSVHSVNSTNSKKCKKINVNIFLVM